MRSLRAAGLSLGMALLMLPGDIVLSQSSAGLVGTWQARMGPVTITLTCNPDGTGKMDDADIRYSVSGNVLSVQEEGAVNRYTFSLSGNTLVLSGGDLDRPISFERQGASAPRGIGGRLNQAPASAGGSGAGGSSPGPGPVGTWETSTPNGPLRLALKPDGTGTFGPGAVRWQYSQNVLTLVGPSGTPVAYNVAISGNAMTITGGGLTEAVVFRAAGLAAAGTASAGPGAAPGASGAPSQSGVRGGGQAGGGGQGGGVGGSSLVGSWQGPQGLIQIMADGKMFIQNTAYRYTVQGNTLTLIGNDGSLPMPFQLNGNSLTVSLNGQTAVLTRVTGAAQGGSGGGGAGIAELAGKWCYFSSFSANAGGGSMTDECFTINANGTYSYHREGSISAYAGGMYGGTASQTDDRGTVQLQGTILMVNSQSQGASSYNVTKRNHEKTGDAMLCLDGRCFVTAYQRPAWR
jgi:hypothetical protein